MGMLRLPFKIPSLLFPLKTNYFPEIILNTSRTKKELLEKSKYIDVFSRNVEKTNKDRIGKGDVTIKGMHIGNIIFGYRFRRAAIPQERGLLASSSPLRVKRHMHTSDLLE